MNREDFLSICDILIESHRSIVLVDSEAASFKSGCSFLAFSILSAFSYNNISPRKLKSSKTTAKYNSEDRCLQVTMDLGNDVTMIGEIYLKSESDVIENQPAHVATDMEKSGILGVCVKFETVVYSEDDEPYNLSQEIENFRTVLSPKIINKIGNDKITVN